MTIPKSFIDQLILSCDIEDLVSAYIHIQRAGRNKKALCPFHGEKTPSLTIYPETQSFYCFGCGVGGDVISFIMQIESLSYVEAISFLARRAGLSLPDNAQEDQISQQKDRILVINREAALFFHQTLKSSAGKQALSYLRGRGISDAIITKYGLGYAPNGWSNLRNYLKKKGFSYEEMHQAGMVAQSKKDHYYDLFRNRVIFPIINLHNQVIAFGGRVLDDEKPKYLNSPDTLIFKKSRNLFSLNFAKNSKGKSFVLAEGYMDVIAIYSAGIPHVVATLGTALTQPQALLLSKYTDEIILAYDADEAGQKASFRAKELLEQTGILIKMLSLTGAKDPDEYIKKFGAKRFELLLEQSQEVLTFQLQKLEKGMNLEQASEKTVYLNKACELLAQRYHLAEREVYAGMIAKKLNISRDSVLMQVESMRKYFVQRQKKQQWNRIQNNKNLQSNRVNPEKLKYLKEATAEQRIIGLLLHNDEYIPYFMQRMKAEEFTTKFNKRVLYCLLEQFEKKNSICLSDLLPFFTTEEYHAIAQMVAHENELPERNETLDQLIQTIQQSNRSLLKYDLSHMTGEEINQKISSYKK